MFHSTRVSRTVKKASKKNFFSRPWPRGKKRRGNIWLMWGIVRRSFPSHFCGVSRGGGRGKEFALLFSSSLVRLTSKVLQYMFTAPLRESPAKKTIHSFAKFGTDNVRTGQPAIKGYNIRTCTSLTNPKTSCCQVQVNPLSKPNFAERKKILVFFFLFSCARYRHRFLALVPPLRFLGWQARCVRPAAACARKKCVYAKRQE